MLAYKLKKKWNSRHLIFKFNIVITIKKSISNIIKGTIRIIKSVHKK